MQSAQITKSIDDILARHLSHPSNYAAVDCVLCLACARYHVILQDVHERRSREILKDIAPDAVARAVDEFCSMIGRDDQVSKVLIGGSAQ